MEKILTDYCLFMDSSKNLADSNKALELLVEKRATTDFKFEYIDTPTDLDPREIPRLWIPEGYISGLENIKTFINTTYPN